MCEKKVLREGIFALDVEVGYLEERKGKSLTHTDVPIRYQMNERIPPDRTNNETVAQLIIHSNFRGKVNIFL